MRLRAAAGNRFNLHQLYSSEVSTRQQFSMTMIKMCGIIDGSTTLRVTLTGIRIIYTTVYAEARAYTAYRLAIV